MAFKPAFTILPASGFVAGGSGNATLHLEAKTRTTNFRSLGAILIIWRPFTKYLNWRVFL